VKALTLHQPYASLMAIAAKRYETRSRRWDCLLGQDVAICSAKTFPAKYRTWAYHDPIFRATLSAAHLIPTQQTGMVPENLPLGFVLCVVQIASVSDTEWFTGGTPVQFQLSAEERAFGDYSEGRFVYTTRNLRALKHPVSVRGYQGIFNLPPDVEKLVRSQL
jgi:hypothetical protein